MSSSPTHHLAIAVALPGPTLSLSLSLCHILCLPPVYRGNNKRFYRELAEHFPRKPSTTLGTILRLPVHPIGDSERPVASPAPSAWDVERKFLDSVTADMVSRMCIDPGKTRDLFMAVVDTPGLHSTRSLPAPKKVILLEPNSMLFYKMASIRPDYVEIVNSDIYYVASFTNKQLDVDVLNCGILRGTWLYASGIVQERFLSGLYASGTLVRLSVVGKADCQSAVVTDVVTWASQKNLAVQFFCVGEWGPAVSKWAIDGTDSIVYEHQEGMTAISTFIFRLY